MNSFNPFVTIRYVLHLPGRTAGKAPIATICDRKYSGGIAHDSHTSPVHVANIIAHEIGHNLGLNHDHVKQCACSDHSQGKCIMNGHIDHFVKSYSECSRQSFDNFLKQGSVLEFFVCHIKRSMTNCLRTR